MAYRQTNRYPGERASKLGHRHLIENPHLHSLLESFQSSAPDSGSAACLSGHLDLSAESCIEQVITVDGGECFPENFIHPERQLAFITICAMPLKTSIIERMRCNPIPDPRELSQILPEGIWLNGGTIPLSAVRIPGHTVRETVRHSIDQILTYTGLYPALSFLVSREWNPDYEMGSGDGPHFECRNCSQMFYVPKLRLRFNCPACRFAHTLSDYLQIDQYNGDELIQGETAQALRNALEVLAVFHFIRITQDQPGIMRKTLFIRDGPLLLRAGLHRLVDDLRAYVLHLKGKGIRLNLMGLEKDGAMVSHVKAVGPILTQPGDFFLPDYRYIAEDIYGRHFNPLTFRNRALFGVKVFTRLGPHHLLALNIPTTDYARDPEPDDLLEFDAILSALSRLLSYQFENALIPIVLANRYASLSRRFSGNILDALASKYLSSSNGDDRGPNREGS